MKTILLLASVLSFAVMSMSCKSQKNTTTTAATTDSAADSKEQTYRLIVSFTSKGAGVNAEKRTAFLAYVESHPKKPANKAVLWGREGETDYCLSLKELSKKEQTDFINDVKKVVSGSDQVILSENAICQHKGR
ncbi:MAG: hypothetical protein V4506_12140 [Bacteroidota bacterium]